MSALITPEIVALDADLGSDKHDVIRALAGRVADSGRATDVDALIADALAREGVSATGLPGGLAIPHCRTSGVDEPVVAFARLSPPVDFGAKDGPAELAFLIGAPEGGDATHLTILTKLARALARPEFGRLLRETDSPEQAAQIILEAVEDGASSAGTAAAAPAQPRHKQEATAEQRSLVAVTACPTGIAHTYMAAEALQAAAARAGVEIAVETQGSAGTTPLPAETIANADADAAIFAVDVGVRDRGRFAGKPLVSSGVKRPIDDADAMITEALAAASDPNAARVESSGHAASSESASASEGWGARTRRILMTGVSYMIPFVAAGGLLIALSFLLGGYDITDVYGAIMVDSTITNLPDVQALGLEHALFDSALAAYLGALFFVIGKTAFMLFIPALAGYIAYAIADRPGIAPGFIMGALATNLFGVVNADDIAAPATGFLGAIAGGVLAGVIAHWVSGWRVPSWARGLMPVLVIPLVTSVLAGLAMIVVLGKPINWLMEQLTNGLAALDGTSAVALGAVLGLMMAFDMGGPLNKVAYSFAATGVGAATLATNAPELRIMAAVMLGGMVPPIALALATVVRPQLFTSADRENGKAGWLLGASFITEGAIPFAAGDPMRVIPAIMVGSAVTGGLSQLFEVGVRAPHGGIFVLFAVSNVLGYLFALAAGVIVGAATVIALKSIGRTPATADVAS